MLEEIRRAPGARCYLALKLQLKVGVMSGLKEAVMPQVWRGALRGTNNLVLRVAESINDNLEELDI